MAKNIHDSFGQSAMRKMAPGGIHLLLTYKCNASCDHCFLSCGPERSGLISLDEARKYLSDAVDMPYINHFFIEGGEPFLYPELLNGMAAEITARGYWLGVLTNGFWACSDISARDALAPLEAAGIGSLGVSTDAWHNRYVPIERAERAVRIAGEMGLDADLMVCTGGPEHSSVRDRLKEDGYDFYTSDLICRGRASGSPPCRTGTHEWNSLTRCSATFGGDSRVHIGPDGEIHLCQGLLLGRDARKEPLADIFAQFRLEDHPLCAALDSGGPAALARLAMEFGFIPESGYTDGCQLCHEARRHLLEHFPRLIGPTEMYAAPR